MELGAFEAKNTLGALLDRVERGEEIVITRHGRPVARLVPYSSGIDVVKARAAVDRIRARGAELRLGSVVWEELKRERDEGRP